MAKLTQNLWKKGWLQLLLEKTKTLYKILDPTDPTEKNASFRKSCFLDHRSFLWLGISLSFCLTYLLTISTTCYFSFYQLISWEHCLVIHHCSKSKSEHMLYLSLSDCNGTRTHNHLVGKRTLKHP